MVPSSLILKDWPKVTLVEHSHASTSIQSRKALSLTISPVKSSKFNYSLQ